LLLGNPSKRFSGKYLDEMEGKKKTAQEGKP
jgi:hypothetical protein